MVFFYKADDKAEVIKELASQIKPHARRAIKKSGVFRVVVSAGFNVEYLLTALPQIPTDLSKWKFFLAEECFVRESSFQSTAGIYKRALMPLTIFKEEQFVCYKTSDVSPAKCAKDYVERIRKEFEMAVSDDSIPQFDLLLLGMDLNGQTCALFAGHELLNEEKELVAPVDAPFPPIQRVTMTFPLLNKAKCCIMALTGMDMAENVKLAFLDLPSNVPAGMISPENDNLMVILDLESGKYIHDEQCVQQTRVGTKIKEEKAD